LLKISIPVIRLRIPVAKVSRKPLHLPVKNESRTNPAPAASSIHPSATTESIVVQTAVPEAIKPSTIKKTPNAKYQPHLRCTSANPVRKRLRALSKKLALLIYRTPFF
jgi:hypothetical protein